MTALLSLMREPGENRDVSDEMLHRGKTFGDCAAFAKRADTEEREGGGDP